MSNLLHAIQIGQPADAARVRRSTPTYGCTGNWSAPAVRFLDAMDASMFAKVHGRRPRGGPS